MSEPIDNLITAFWKCLADDLKGKGCTLHELPYRMRKDPTLDKVKAERDIIQAKAHDFLDSEEFDIWSRVSGFAPADLRRRFKELA
jgi:hypothetical protein